MPCPLATLDVSLPREYWLLRVDERPQARRRTEPEIAGLAGERRGYLDRTR
jgi:hypothetical protein